MARKQKIGSMQTRAIFDPSTLNDEQRTVEVTFATDTPVRMSSWMDGPYDEILSFEAGHVRWDRINSGAPLLDNHDRWRGVNGVLGIVEKAWTDDNKKGRAIVRFSKREDVEEVYQDVRDGILKGISVGYRVHKYELTNPERKNDEVPVYRAVDWEPFEISLAPIQADINSAVRSTSAELNEVEIVFPNSHNTMKRELIIAALKKRGISVSDNITDDDLLATLERAMSTEPAPAPAPAPTPTPAPAGEDTRAAVEAERKRSAEILKAVRAAKLSDEFATELIEGGKTLDQARAAIIEKWAEGDPNASTRSQSSTRVAADETDKRRNAMQVALEHRTQPSSVAPDKIQGNEYRGMSLIRMAEEAVIAAGGRVRGLSAREIASAALNLDRQRAGMHSTSDFPIILGNTINRRLLAEYALAPRTFAPWTRRETAADFREMTRARFGEHSGLNKVVEGGEYKLGTLGESKEAYKVEKFGEIIAVTWETLVNDDLSAFNRLPAKIANAAARKQSDIIYGILSANPNMSDNVALFHTATHKNLAGSAGVIDVKNLGAARKAMREQKGIDNKDFLNLMPKFLLVGPSQETYALQYTSSAYVPDQPGQINPWKGLEVIVEPRITGNEWYVIGDPNAADTIEYAFLEGEGELFTETKEGFEVDGLMVKARMVFGAKAIDWRNMYKNPGALPA